MANYERINWENYPSTETPLDADNLNKMDQAIDSLNSELTKSKSNISALETKIRSLETRFASLIRLEDGSTTGDAELQDGRIGYDGTEYEILGDAIRGQVGEINERLDSLDAGAPYAPAIIAETEEAFSHSGIANPISIKFRGNPYAFGTAKYTDSVNYMPDFEVSGTEKDISYSVNGHFCVLNGTGAGTSRFNVVTLEKAPPYPLAAGTYTYIVAMEKTGSTINSSMRIFLQAQYTDGTSETLKDKYVKDGYTETVTVSKEVRKLRIDIGSYGGNIHSNTIVWFSLYNSSATIVDTNETVGASGSYDYALTNGSGITALDTMQHSSVVTYAADTKAYVDNLNIDINEKLTYITPERFGAKGDGSTDDTVALQACVDYAVKRTGSVPVAIRGYGHYKTSSPIVIHGYYPDIVINRITYTGNDAAVIIHSMSGKFVFGLIAATTGTNAVGIRCSATATPELSCDGFTDNRLECGFLYTGGNSLELIYPSTAETEGIYYNVFTLPRLWSNNANLIYVNAPKAFAENDFYGKMCHALNGYLYYREPVHNNSTHVSIRLHQFSMEQEVKNGIYGNVALVECRTREMMDRRTISDSTLGGFLFDFTGVVPNATKDDLGGDVDLTSLIYDTALTFDDVIDLVKDAYAGGERDTYKLGSILGSNGFSYALLKNCVRASIGGYYTLPSDVYVYYNHMAVKPLEDWYYQVSGDMTIHWSAGSTYITPTIFDINASSVTITLDDSYCCLAINQFQVIQHDGKTAIVYDKLGNKIFDGTNLGEGTFRFTCSREPLTTLSVEMENGDTYTFDAQTLIRVYTGENEKWTITKETVIN